MLRLRAEGEKRVPVQELEEHGLTQRDINWLDDHGIIWVDQLQTVTPEWLLSRPQAGPELVEALRTALRRFFGESE